MTYWERRQQQLNEQLEKDEAALKKRLSTYYNQEARRLEKEIAAYYSQYGENNVLEYRTLMESLSDGDRRLLLERMDDFAKKYPEYSHLLPIRESIYKLNRLEGLQQSILIQQLEIGAVDQEQIRAHLEKQALRNANAAAETMGFGKNFYTENPEMIRQIVNTQWANGKNFSERIWDNVKKLSGYLNQDLAQGFARGDSYDRLIKQLRQRFEKVSRNDAYRLIYTEGTFVMNESRAVAFEDSTETYIFRVQYDKIRRNGWRDICDDLNGKIFKWSERKPGINFPPMHTWCHCTATPHIADRASFIEEYERRHGGEQAEKVEKRLSTERGEYSSGIKRVGTNVVDLEYIKSQAFRKKFNQISNHTGVNEALREYATAMLTHRNGTDGEDLYIIDAKTGKLLLRKISGKNELEVGISGSELEKIRSQVMESLIGIHNHPTNLYPTGSDLAAAGYRKYKFGVEVTHDGRVFKYSVGEKPFSPMLFDSRVDKYQLAPYNMSIKEAHEKALNDFHKEYGVIWEEMF